MLIASSCCPAVHVVFRSSAEFQKLVPMHFHEKQDLTDGVLLGIFVTAESITAHMNVQTAGACLMAAVSHLYRTVQNVCPAKFVHVVVKAHRVRDNLKAVIKAAVRFDVDMFPVPIGDFEQLLGVIVVMSTVVYFQFYAEETFALSIQDRGRLIAISFCNIIDDK